MQITCARNTMKRINKLKNFTCIITHKPDCCKIRRLSQKRCCLLLQIRYSRARKSLLRSQHNIALLNRTAYNCYSKSDTLFYSVLLEFIHLSSVYCSVLKSYIVWIQVFQYCMKTKLQNVVCRLKACLAFR